jgi:hypothetical protein
MSNRRRSRKPRHTRRLFGLEPLEGRNLLAAFTPGDIAVYRVGDGTETLSSSGNSVFVDEFTPSGGFVQSISMAADTVNAGNSNTLISHGLLTNEGMLTRAADGQSLAMPGYSVALGSLANSTSKRVVGILQVDGGVDLSTTGVFNQGANFRSTFRNGNQIYTLGGSNTAGLAMVTKGTTSGSTLIYTGSLTRTVNIFGGQLYMSSVSGSLRLTTVGTGTPTTSGQTATNLPGFPTSGSPYQFFFADLTSSVAGVDTLYVADDGSNGGEIQKFSLSGGTWSPTGAIAAAAVRGLTGYVVGNSVTLYGATGGSTTSGGGSLYTFTDTTGYNATVSGTATTVATAAAKTAFRGVALVPDDGIGAIGGFGGTLEYTAGDDPVVLDGAATFSDQSSFKGGSLTIDYVSGATSDDTLSIFSGGDIVAASGAVFYSGIEIGTYPESGPGSGVDGEDLIVTFNGVLSSNLVSGDAVQALLQQVSFSTSVSAAGGARELTLHVRQNDGQTAVASATVNVTPLNTNDPPTDIQLSNDTVDENLDAGAAVGTLSTVDPDAGDGFTYELVAGTGDVDNGLFDLTSDGILSTGASFDFESQASYSIRARSTDNGGLSTEKQFTIAVNDINEAPFALQLSGSSVDEDLAAGTTVGVLSASDPDSGDSLEFDFATGGGDDDNGSFAIDSSSGTLTTTDSFDFENANSYTIRVKATDSGGLSTEEAFVVTVNDVNEAPQISLVNAVTSLPENADSSAGIDIADIVIADDALGSRTLWLSGADSSKFKISGSTLRIRPGAVLDLETNPSLDVSININDAAVGSSPDDTDSLSIAITEANEPPTAIALSTDSLAENQPAGTVVGVLSSTDADQNDTFSYQLVSGDGDDGNASFSVDDQTGVVSTTESFDFEAQASYSFRVRTTDAGGLTFEQSLRVSVVDVNDPPEIALMNQVVSLPENAGPSASVPVGDTPVADIVISDDALGSKTYYILGGLNDDASLFRIDAETQQLLLRADAVIDFETNPELSVTVVVDDPALGSSWESSATLVIAVTDVEESPAIGGQAVSNEAPVLTPIAPAMIPISQGMTNPFVTELRDLLGASISDSDGAGRGIAVTWTGGANFGRWQYHLGFGTWVDVGPTSSAAARLIPASASLRFLPNSNFHGDVKLYYRAWDRTQGTVGGVLDLTHNIGGTSSISRDYDHTTQHVNMSPVLGQSDSDPHHYALDTSGIHFLWGASSGKPATLIDRDSPDFAGGVLRVHPIAGKRTGDRIEPSWNFSISGTNVFFKSTQVGTTTADGRDGNDLRILFNSEASRDLVRRLMNSLTFRTENGIATTRKFEVRVWDGDGAASNTLVRTVIAN